MPITILTLGSSRKGKHMAKEYTHGPTERFTMANGIMVWSMGMEFGKESKMTHIMANGTNPELMDMEFIRGQTVIDTKESGTSAWNMVMGPTLSLLVMFTQANTKMAKPMVKVSTLGKTDKYTQVNSKMEWNTELANGGAQEIHVAILTKDNTAKIWNMAREFTNGKVETYIKENTRTMRDMAKEKWFGLMEVFMMAAGKEVYNTGVAEWCFLMVQKKKECSVITSFSMNCPNLCKGPSQACLKIKLHRSV